MYQPPIVNFPVFSATWSESTDANGVTTPAVLAAGGGGAGKTGVGNKIVRGLMGLLREWRGGSVEMPKCFFQERIPCFYKQYNMGTLYLIARRVKLGTLRVSGVRGYRRQRGGHLQRVRSELAYCRHPCRLPPCVCWCLINSIILCALCNAVWPRSSRRGSCHELTCGHCRGLCLVLTF